MTTGVLVAMSDRWETSVVTALDRCPGVRVVRRCADLADLLAAASAGLAPVAIVSADLRQLDRSALEQLLAQQLAVVGVHAPGDDAGERRLHQLGATAVLPADSPPLVLAAAIEDAQTPSGESSEAADGTDQDGAQQAGFPVSPRPRPAGHGDSKQPPAGAAPTPAAAAAAVDLRTVDQIEQALAGVRPSSDEAGPRTADGGPPSAPTRPAASAASPSWTSRRRAREVSNAHDGAGDPDDGTPGRILAVWGPAGAPGRTTVAVNLAAELAQRGSSVLLVDADTYGGCVAQVLSLLDEAPGIAAATRAAEHGTLDLAVLARLAPEAAPRLRVLTGIPKAERWTEVRAAPLEQVLRLGRRLARWTVVDCGFSLEDDEELSYDTLAPRRNAATLTVLAAADRLLAVGAADPIGLQRLVRGLQELGTVQSPRPLVVVNKVRAAAVGKDPERRIAEALARFAGVKELRFLPGDHDTMDAVLLAGRCLGEAAQHSLLRQAFARLAAQMDQELNQDMAQEMDRAMDQESDPMRGDAARTGGRRSRRRR